MLGLNTRNKIITEGELSAVGPVRLLAGFFDPLLPETIAAIEELRAGAEETQFAAVVDTPSDPLLPLSARVELAASLRAITYVVAPASPALVALAERLPEPRTEFLRHVRGRVGRATPDAVQKEVR